MSDCGCTHEMDCAKAQTIRSEINRALVSRPRDWDTYERASMDYQWHKNRALYGTRKHECVDVHE